MKGDTKIHHILKKFVPQENSFLRFDLSRAQKDYAELICKVHDSGKGKGKLKMHLSFHGFKPISGYWSNPFIIRRMFIFKIKEQPVW
jgi:hypothetical protein